MDVITPPGQGHYVVATDAGVSHAIIAALEQMGGFLEAQAVRVRFADRATDDHAVGYFYPDTIAQ